MSEFTKAVDEQRREIDQIAADLVRSGESPGEALAHAQRIYQRRRGRYVVEPMTP